MSRLTPDQQAFLDAHKARLSAVYRAVMGQHTRSMLIGWKVKKTLTPAQMETYRFFRSKELTAAEALQAMGVTLV